MKVARSRCNFDQCLSGSARRLRSAEVGFHRLFQHARLATHDSNSLARAIVTAVSLIIQQFKKSCRSSGACFVNELIFENGSQISCSTYALLQKKKKRKGDKTDGPSPAKKVKFAAEIATVAPQTSSKQEESAAVAPEKSEDIQRIVIDDEDDNEENGRLLACTILEIP